MLATAKEVLADAQANRYAVPAFDCIEDVMVRAVLETAEARGAPVFIMALQPDLEGNGWAYFAGLVRAVADHHKIPVVLHLDHADRLEPIRRAVDLGFTSVMIDGSSLPFTENVKITKAAVDVARPRGVSVEGELGHVGGLDLEETEHRENVLTEPEEVARFVDETGVDALAVSIGTAHGVYRSLPTLNLERLAELRQACPVPLVLHGGSGTPAAQIREAVRGGITKLNVYADCRQAMARGLKTAHASLDRPDPLPRDLFRPIKEEIAAVVKEKIELLLAANRSGALRGVTA